MGGRVTRLAAAFSSEEWQDHVGMKTGSIMIVDYRPEWVTEYAKLAERLCASLGDLALRVDHIGSTAVPGLAAKDIVDIQVTVADFSASLEPAFARAHRAATISWSASQPNDETTISCRAVRISSLATSASVPR